MISKELLLRLRSFTFWSTLIWLSFIVLYIPINYFTQFRDTYQIYFAWELNIPFYPSWIYIYYSLFFAFMAFPFFIKDTKTYKLIFKTAFASYIIADIIYLIFPAELGFHRSVEVLGYENIFNLLFFIDWPHNLVPSLHVTMSYIISEAICHGTKNKWVKVFFRIWIVLVSVSIVLVHQHHVVDLITGLLLGMFCFEYVFIKGIKKELEKI